jgi:hypothetical protein
MELPLIPILTLAARLEAEGQYNLAKLARATADALARQASYQNLTSNQKPGLVEAINEVAEALSGLELPAGLFTAFQQGTATLAEGRLPLINEVPHPFVCRTCGTLVMGVVESQCPNCGARPATFQWFPPIYWLEALNPFNALEKLRQTPLEVAALLEGLSEQAMTRPPADGGWAIRNIISHLRDAQGVISFRLDQFLKEENPKLESKAVFAWATNEAERPPSTRQIFAEYEISRGDMVTKLASISLADWWRTGQHEEFGLVTLLQQVSYFTMHELTHLPQIQALRNQ